MKRSEFDLHNKEQLLSIKSRYEERLFQNILPFWEARIIDIADGGYYSCFNREGMLTSDDKAVWFVGRNIFIFSKLINTFGFKQEWMDIVTTGLEFSKKCFNPDGSMKYLVNRKGESITNITSVFTEMFFCQGLLEFSKIDSAYKEDTYKTNNFRDWMKYLYETSLSRLDDASYLVSMGYDPAISNLSVSFMRLMLVNDGIDTFDFGSNYIENEIEKILYLFANDEDKTHYSNVLNADKSNHTEDCLNVVNPGHSMEALSIAFETCKKLNREKDLARSSEILSWLIEKTKDPVYGGYILNTDKTGKSCPSACKTEDWLGLEVACDDKIWWVQYEALCTSIMYALENNDEKLIKEFFELDTFIENNFLDKNGLEAFGFLQRDCLIKDDKKGSFLKGPYHIVRSYLKIIELIDSRYN